MLCEASHGIPLRITNNQQISVTGCLDDNAYNMLLAVLLLLLCLLYCCVCVFFFGGGGYPTGEIATIRTVIPNA